MEGKNTLERYMNMALMIKAYLDSEEDYPYIVAFKKIPKDVLLYIFKLAYPELPPKTIKSVSRLFLFKPPLTISDSEADHKTGENNKKKGIQLSAVLFKYLCIEMSLREEKDAVVLSFSADAGNLDGFRHITELCRQKIPRLLPYNNRYDIDFVTAEPERVLELEKPFLPADEEHLYQIAVMGEVCSGKTAFVHRFVGNTYSEYFKASIGVDRKTKNISMGHAVCKVWVWDFAGTRAGDIWTHMFLRYTSGIILTVDLTRRQNYEETYKRILRDSEFPSLPVLLVGMKADICQPDDIKRFSVIADQLNLPFIVVSSKTGENVEAAFVLLLKMIMMQKFPGYVLRLRMRKATLDWFDVPRFYGQLNQILVEDASVIPLTKMYNYKHGLYESAVQRLNEWEDEEGLCKFYIKNYDNDENVISADAIRNVEQYKDVSPHLITRVIKAFHLGLLSENSGIRREAIHGLRVLGKLNTEIVKNTCVMQFHRIVFHSHEWLKKIAEKINEHKKPELVRKCILGMSAIHSDCFSILQEIGEQKMCEEISTRVLHAFEEYIKQHHPVAKVLPGKKR